MIDEKIFSELMARADRLRERGDLVPVADRLLYSSENHLIITVPFEDTVPVHSAIAPARPVTRQTLLTHFSRS